MSRFVNEYKIRFEIKVAKIFLVIEFPSNAAVKYYNS